MNWLQFKEIIFPEIIIKSMQADCSKVMKLSQCHDGRVRAAAVPPKQFMNLWILRNQKTFLLKSNKKSSVLYSNKLQIYK